MSSLHDTDDNNNNALSLSQALKQGTSAVHVQAEHVHFVRNFFQGHIHHDLYTHLIITLFYVYQGLEQLLDKYAPLYFASCHFPKELRRTQALAEDLDFWLGSSEPPVPPTPATRDYLNRLDDIARNNPLLLLAHAYTRYLGDLSGGKILGRVAQRALHVDKNAGGMDFFQFPHVPSAKRFKEEYKRAMNALPLTPAQFHALVAEANIAFGLNIRLFEELDVYARVPGARVRPLTDVWAYADPAFWQQPSSSKYYSTTSVEKCPFLVQDKAVVSPKTQCPWPFVVFHHPVHFVNHWKTRALLATMLVVTFLWLVSVGAPTKVMTNILQQLSA